MLSRCTWTNGIKGCLNYRYGELLVCNRHIHNNEILLVEAYKEPVDHRVSIKSKHLKEFLGFNNNHRLRFYKRQADSRLDMYNHVGFSCRVKVNDTMIVYLDSLMH